MSFDRQGRQTNRHDRNYIPCRFAGGQLINLIISVDDELLDSGSKKLEINAWNVCC